MERIFLYGGSYDKGVELIFTDQERKKEEIIDEEIKKKKGVISKMQQEKLRMKRAAAQRQGLIAQKLQDLRSKSKKPFVKEKKKVLPGGFQRAIVSEDGLIIKEAYLCQITVFKKKNIGCGWVKGIPQSKSIDYTKREPGKQEYHCKICNRLIGEFP